MRNTAIFTALLLIFGATTVDAQEYIRYRQGRTQGDGALQIAVESWKTPNGVTVDLYGVVHMADADYYRLVQRDLDRYDSVLYEGIKAGKKPNKETAALNALQGGIARVMGFQFQKAGISYVGSNMVHADIDASALEKKLDGQKLTPFGGMISPETLDALKPFIKFAGVAVDEFFNSRPDLRNNMRASLAQQLSSSDVEKQLPPKMRQAIIVDRNLIVLRALDKRLAKTNDKRIAIFYGAGHNPDFARRFLARGYTRGTKRWMTAWRIGNGPARSRTH